MTDSASSMPKAAPLRLAPVLSAAGPALDKPDPVDETDRHAKDVAAAIALQTIMQRKQKGRRRADAVLGVLRAMADEGRDMHDISSDDADCIWTVNALLNRCAGQPEHSSDARPADSPKAAGAKTSDRTLDASVEAPIASDAT